MPWESILECKHFSFKFISVTAVHHLLNRWSSFQRKAVWIQCHNENVKSWRSRPIDTLLNLYLRFTLSLRDVCLCFYQKLNYTWLTDISIHGSNHTITTQPESPCIWGVVILMRRVSSHVVVTLSSLSGTACAAGERLLVWRRRDSPWHVARRSLSGSV